jgi:hypothetical protein
VILKAVLLFCAIPIPLIIETGAIQPFNSSKAFLAGVSGYIGDPAHPLPNNDSFNFGLYLFTTEYLHSGIHEIRALLFSPWQFNGCANGDAVTTKGSVRSL